MNTILPANVYIYQHIYILINKQVSRVYQAGFQLKDTLNKLILLHARTIMQVIIWTTIRMGDFSRLNVQLR